MSEHTNTLLFSSREAAGALLARRIVADNSDFDCIVAIPNGGIIVAASVAARLNRPMLLCCATRIVAPGREDLGIGAVYSTSGKAVLNSELIQVLGLSHSAVLGACRDARRRLGGARRDGESITDLQQLAAASRILVIDDGIATGYTMTAAVELVNQCDPSRVVAAAPVVSSYGFQTVAPLVSQIIYLHYGGESEFRVDYYYHHFPNISSEEIRSLGYR